MAQGGEAGDRRLEASEGWGGAFQVDTLHGTRETDALGPLAGVVLVGSPFAEQGEGLVQGGQGGLVLTGVGVDPSVSVSQSTVQGAAAGLVPRSAGLVGDPARVGEEGEGDSQASDPCRWAWRRASSRRQLLSCS
jgi:hypothetical protein